MKNLLVSIFILFICVEQNFSQTKNFIDQPYIETRAKVDTLVTPDRIYLNIIITEKDTKGKISVEALEAKMESKLNSMGIDTEKNLTLNDLASNFKKYFLKQQDVLKIKSYTLMVTNAVMAGKAIIALEDLSISNVTVDRTEYSGIENLKLALKSKVILKAKKQAESLCKPLNQKIGRAIYISDTYSNFQGRASNIQIRGMTSMKANHEFKPANIQFEKIKIETEVNVKFILE
jgi:uncharacterized protein YggE